MCFKLNLSNGPSLQGMPPKHSCLSFINGSVSAYDYIYLGHFKVAIKEIIQKSLCPVQAFPGFKGDEMADPGSSIEYRPRYAESRDPFEGFFKHFKIWVIPGKPLPEHLHVANVSIGLTGEI